MSIGDNLNKARKKAGLTQEEVALNLGISRQTVSNWECDETLPDIFQAKRLAHLYKLALDDLIDLDLDLKDLQEVITKSDDKKYQNVDWTKMWSKKYPVLASYQTEVDIDRYADELIRLLRSLEETYGYDRLDSMLVLKDILAKCYKK